jgi:hypothetical protein
MKTTGEKAKGYFNKDNLSLTRGDVLDCVESILSSNTRSHTIIIPHVCNNVDVFGAGFAKAVSDRYPIVKENYHLIGPNFLKNNLGYVQFVTAPTKHKNHKLVFANMIAQNGLINRSNQRPLNYGALTIAMYRVKNFIKQAQTESDKSDKIEIHAPRFGAGLSGGKWEFIQDLVKDIWTGVPVYIYKYES